MPTDNLASMVTQADLEDFLGDVLRRRSANTAATRYKVLRVLWRWLEKEQLPNPMARLKPPIVPEQPIPILPADGLRRLHRLRRQRLRGPTSTGEQVAFDCTLD
jgi:hypothetical protein